MKAPKMLPNTPVAGFDRRTEAYMEIPLTRGLVALVDADDYEWLSRWSWHAHKARSGFYAARGETKKSKRKTYYMHRELLGLTAADKRVYVDHINDDRLDNRRANLRRCTPGQNVANARHAASEYRGAYFHKASGLWHARICVHGSVLSLKYHRTAKDAAATYDRAALEHYGEFACLNFPKEAGR